ncbi:hypothetical protein THAOC_12956 [Thalassiosira oceanica]|uniref:alkylglycerone-phosphate synthase n=1 Tax=Thalassiosira oceanica TaxID=159749 RepID=K0SMF7_THAOC|nr:hypothetical protein THAOC_12956 [Thalassiosira oceanica]|eukprot:EJK66139.1 hypothetical protein THAOC_12956 [Thalassiosira oceanica]
MEVEQRQRLENCFERVAALVRHASSPTDDPPSDTLRLNLYGYFKLSTSSVPSSGVPRPSFFDPVGRAKHAAWKAAEDECQFDRALSMERYIQAVIGSGTDVGREAGALWGEYLRRLGEQEPDESHTPPTHAAKAGDDDDDKSSAVAGEDSDETGESLTRIPASRKTFDRMLASEQLEQGQSASRHRGSQRKLLSLLPRPLVPRGQLDIALRDLLYAHMQCALSVTYEFFLSDRGMLHRILSFFLPSFILQMIGVFCARYHPERRRAWSVRKINERWREMERRSSSREGVKSAEKDVVVGLSVRSLLDLYLSSKSYPAGSEILLVPPVTIPAIVNIIEYHDLRLVGIDLPRIGGETRWGVDVEALRQAVSDKTVALMLVHPFGCRIADLGTMRDLRKIANGHSLDIIEDCAQSYTGICTSKKGHIQLGYLGSEEADVSLFSFGPIKTSTALGGGLAVLRRRKGVAKSMRRMQESLYQPQRTTSYYVRLLKCTFVQLASQSTYCCGFIKILLDSVGIEYSWLVMKLTRGFDCRGGQQEVIRQIRRRPCPALLALLNRRLQQSHLVYEEADKRRRRCESFSKVLARSEMSNLSTLKSVDGGDMYNWIFPVFTSRPVHTSRSLISMGFDAPCGMTQLRPLENCVRAKEVFDHIMYLPVTSQKCSESSRRKLVSVLQDACSDIATEKSTAQKRSATWKAKSKTMLFILAILLERAVSVVGLFQFATVRLAIRVAKVILPWIFMSVAFVACSLLALSRYMGPIYLSSSRTFAKYCDMVFRSPFDCEVSRPEHKAFERSQTVLSLDSTRIPTVLRSEDGGEPCVMLTGVTGFIGSLLLREILLHRDELSIGSAVVIVRPKRGRSAIQRVERLLSQAMFSFLSEDEKKSLVIVVEGDVTQPYCGITPAVIESSIQVSKISHVLHCAAAVSFSQPLEDAATSNITSSLNVQSLAKQLDAKFTYLSTAFVHGDRTGTKSRPLPEAVFSLKPYDPDKLYESMLGSQSYASAAMNDLGFPNTYTFSKCVCEHLLEMERDVETTIIRPSIVGPSVEEPYEGWAGERPSTIVAAACLYLKFPYNMWCFGHKPVPFVPVDVVCRVIISKSFGSDLMSEADVASYFRGQEEEKKEQSPIDTGYRDSTRKSPAISTVAWDSSSPERSTFSWVQYAFAITHLGSVCGHVDRTVAYAGLLLSTKLFPWLGLSLATFRQLHAILVRTPVDKVLEICKRLRLRSAFVRDLDALSPVLDLPMLFFPFANRSFYFQSQIRAPDDFNGERYMFSCAVAAHRFIERIENQRKRSKHGRLEDGSSHPQRNCRNASIYVAGKCHAMPASDLWWALTQPTGSLTIRFGAWVLSKIFRRTAREIGVDVASYAVLARTLASTDAASVILAPTHRSFYDFLITSYISFALPELGVGIPHIAAASDFQHVPIIGILAAWSNAFFLRRDGKGRDTTLQQDLSRIISRSSPAFIEVFIEGKRSRSRAFLKPKTGFLRCLCENIEGSHLVLPSTINYEGLVDQMTLVEETSRVAKRGMGLFRLSQWLRAVILNKVDIGRVYISASPPIIVGAGTLDVRGLGNAIQERQRSRTLVSEYHVEAASSVLGVPSHVIRESMQDLGMIPWPPRGATEPLLAIPSCQNVAWTTFFHFAHIYAPYLAQTHQTWSEWLCPSSSKPKKSESSSVNVVVSILTQHLEAADNEVVTVLKYLAANGFDSPTESHVFQYLSDVKSPAMLLLLALKTKMVNRAGTIPLRNMPRLEDPHLFRRQKVLKNNVPLENFAAWGFQDSYFVLNESSDGAKIVTMKGSRYDISGKQLPNLARFVEEELRITIDPMKAPKTCCDFVSVRRDAFDEGLATGILAVLGNDKDRFSTRAVDRARHGTGHTQQDIFDLRFGNIRSRVPDAVVWPKSILEVEALVSFAVEESLCLIPFGGGTNVTHATHCPPREVDPRPMVSIDMKLMNGILWVNEEDGLVHVEAGITGGELIRRVEKLGFTIGHIPDSYEFSTLGGWIATKASGMKQNKYGNIEDIVKDVTVVGSKGILSTSHRISKTTAGRSSAGLEPKSLALGSEGCFGIITSAVLKISPIPEVKSYQSVLLPSFGVGVEYMRALSKMTMKPASVRLLDNDQFRLGQALKERPSLFGTLREWLAHAISSAGGNFSLNTVVCVTISFEGSAAEVNLQQRLVRDFATVYEGMLAGPSVGKAGYDLTFAIAYLRDFALNYDIIGESFETFVPWSCIKRLVAATKDRVQFEHRHRALPGEPFICSRITQLYDEGVCVYFYFCMQIKGVSNPSVVFSEIEHIAREEILSNGGSLSHHHGLGKVRSSFVSQIYSQAYIDTLTAIKNSIDERNVFGAANGIFGSKMYSSSIEHTNVSGKGPKNAREGSRCGFTAATGTTKTA